MGWRIRNYCLSNLFKVDIQVYRYSTSIVPNHEYIHPNSNLTVRLYFLNGDHFYLLEKTLNLKTNTANLNQNRDEKMCKIYTHY